MTKAEEIRARLEAAFQPHTLEVINESSKHSGHGGDDGSGESHFRLRIGAPALGKMTRIARHRAVHDALGQDLVGSIHALALEVSG